VAWGSVRASGRSPKVKPLELVAIVLACLGAAVSLVQSSHVAQSYGIFLGAFLAPAVLFISARCGGLPANVLAGSFLGALTAALLRADVVFVQANGFPAPAKLYAGKFANQFYDFHYYTLGNPDHTATFLLLPLTVGLTWSTAQGVARRTRILLAVATFVVLITLVLLYVRVPLLVAAVLLIVALARLPWSRWGRAVGLGVAVCAMAAFVVLSPHHYLTDVGTGGHSSSEVRISSIGVGFRTFLHHPITGVGLGQYGSASGVPAHSSVIEAAAEMGAAGLLGITVITIGLAVAAVRRWRPEVNPLRQVALWGSAVYVLVAGFTAGANDGLFVGLISIYGLSLAIFAGIGLGGQPASAEPSVRSACMAISRACSAVVTKRGLAVRASWASIRPAVLSRWSAFLIGGLLLLAVSGAALAERGVATRGVSVSWSFARGAPAGWVIRAPARLHGRELVLRVGATATFQAYSDPIDFPAGTYRYSVTARVPPGAMAVGVLNQQRQRFVAGDTDSPTPTFGQPRTFSGTFTLKAGALLALVLSNARPLHPARWGLIAASIAPAAQGPAQGLSYLVSSWSFAKGLPPPWVSYTHELGQRRKLAVRAGANHGYQLVSPTSRLPPGTYVYSLRARILSGGLEMGTLDQGRSRFLAERSYFASPGQSRIETFVQRFRLNASGSVSLVLSNAEPQGISHWILSSASLIRTR
jgi:hypothetical protein